MINFFEKLNLDGSIGREQNLQELNKQLRKYTGRANHHVPKIRTKAEEMVKLVSDAIDIFSDEGAYNEYIKNLNANRNKQQPNRPVEQNTNKLVNILDRADSLLGIDNNQVYNLIQQALSIDPNYTRTWVIYAMYLGNTNQLDEKFNALDRIEQLSPNEYWMLFEQFKRFTNNYPDIEKVEYYYNRLMTPVPEKESAYGLYFTGCYNMFLGNYDDALSNFVKGKELSNGKNYVESPLNINPHNFRINDIGWDNLISNAYYWKGTYYFKGDSNYLTTEEDVLGHIECMEQALEYNPNNQSARDNLKNARVLMEKESISGILWTGLLIIIGVSIWDFVGMLLYGVIRMILPFQLLRDIVELLFSGVMLVGYIFIIWLFFSSRKAAKYEIVYADSLKMSPYLYKIMTKLGFEY